MSKEEEEVTTTERHETDSTVHEKTPSADVQDPDELDDCDNPRRWSQSIKWASVCLLSFIEFLTWVLLGVQSLALTEYPGLLLR